jgi:ribulose-phosphate 3-epimerase
VAGSAVFSKGKTEQNAKRLLKLARAAAPDKAAKKD